MINPEMILKLELSYWLERLINLKVLNLSNNIVETIKHLENRLII